MYLSYVKILAKQPHLIFQSTRTLICLDGQIRRHAPRPWCKQTRRTTPTANTTLFVLKSCFAVSSGRSLTRTSETSVWTDYTDNTSHLHTFRRENLKSNNYQTIIIHVRVLVQFRRLEIKDKCFRIGYWFAQISNILHNKIIIYTVITTDGRRAVTISQLLEPFVTEIKCKRLRKRGLTNEYQH